MKALSLLIIVFAILSVGCSEIEKLNSYVYDTKPNHENLEKLKGKNLVLVSYNHKNNAVSGIDHLEENISSIVTKELEIKFKQKYSSLFKFISPPKDNVLPKISSSDSKTISEYIKSAGADGGIITVNSYGYKMKGASGVLWTALETAVPEEHKKSYRAVLSHSEVERYYFASVSYLYDANGEVVWQFSGLESVYPSPDFDLGDMGRSLMGADPSGEKVASEMIKAGVYFMDYSKWLIERDLKKIKDKNYFKDYPSGVKDNKIAIYPSEVEADKIKVAW